MLLIVDGDELFVSLASDHTDRAAEAIDIAMSKGDLPEDVRREAWPVASIDGRWGELELRSYHRYATTARCSTRRARVRRWCRRPSCSRTCRSRARGASPC